MNKKKIVVFTGAGVSKESGIETFRDSGGTWEKMDVNEVATPEGWKKDKEKVLDFYNARREQLSNVEPNQAHKLISELEKEHDVTVVTQNVDDLHERAGSTNVLHLHGELTKVRSSLYHGGMLDIPETISVGYKPINVGDKCPETGSQLRPHVVWFGEMPQNIEQTYKALGEADILLIIGTTLFIEYSTSMLGHTQRRDNPNGGNCKTYFIDPDPTTILDYRIPGITYIKEPATVGVGKFIELINESNPV